MPKQLLYRVKLPLELMIDRKYDMDDIREWLCNEGFTCTIEYPHNDYNFKKHPIPGLVFRFQKQTYADVFRMHWIGLDR